MYKLLKYLKYLLFFIIFFFIISLILAFFATFGVSNLFINKLSVILMAIAAFITSMKEIAGKRYLLGLRLGLLNIISLILINLMFFRSSFDITRFIYYFILLISSILGSSFGKNFHKKN